MCNLVAQPYRAAQVLSKAPEPWTMCPGVAREEAAFRQPGGRAAVTRLSWPQRAGWCRDLQIAHISTPTAM
jgi:hypothetical protein